MTEHERLTMNLQTATVRLLAEVGELLGRLPLAEAQPGIPEAVRQARAALADADQAFEVAPHYLPAAG